MSSQFLTQIAAVFGHKTSLWWDLPVRHSFDAIRRIYRVPVDAFRKDVALFAGMLHIDKLMDRTVRQLSLGERIKCEVVLALAHRPRVLLLDEPTIGVDMESKQQLRELINRVVEERQVATLLTTHDVTDLTACCMHIAFIWQRVPDQSNAYSSSSVYPETTVAYWKPASSKPSGRAA